MASKQQTGQSSSEDKAVTYPPEFFRQKTELTEEEKQRRANQVTKARPVQRTSSAPAVSRSRYTCKHCGYSNPITNKFCNKCGKAKLVRTASRGGRRTKRRRRKHLKKRTRHRRRRSSRHRRSRRKRRHTRKRRRHRRGGTLGNNKRGGETTCAGETNCPVIKQQGWEGGAKILIIEIKQP